MIAETSERNRTLIRSIRDSLGDTKRYLKHSPGVVTQNVSQAIQDIQSLDRDDGYRIAENLRVGVACNMAAPDVLRGYLDAACFELLGMLGRQD